MLLVLNVLKEYSDENHYLTQKQIAGKVAELYGMELNRKTIGADIHFLVDRMQYDINTQDNGKGFALLSREFDYNEIQYLVDAVFSSHSIPGKYAKDISVKLSKTQSKYKRVNYDYIYQASNLTRTGNKQVFLNIMVISEAIAHHKKIAFRYLIADENGEMVERQNHKTYIVSPYFFVNNQGKYYLLSNLGHLDEMTNFRVDMMVKVNILENSTARGMEGLADLQGGESISAYINDHVYMFGGKNIEAEFMLKRSYFTYYFHDWFGKMAKFKKTKDGELVAFVKGNERAIFYWALQYIEGARLIKPNDMKLRLINTLKEALSSYE